MTSADVPLSTARMAAAGLGLPDVRVTAESVGASKPDPEGFLKGAAELGVAPADCIVFEDSGAGIAAGKAAGMRVVGVGARAAVHGPDVVVGDLTRVRVEARRGRHAPDLRRVESRGRVRLCLRLRLSRRVGRDRPPTAPAPERTTYGSVVSDSSRCRVTRSYTPCSAT